MSDLNKAAEYIGQSKFVVLATTDGSGVPVVRTLASFANDNLNVYFSTGRNTAKVEQIAANPKVSLLFQHEGQELAGFQNVTLTGQAEPLQSGDELSKAIQLLSDRNPRFKERVAKGGLGDTLIFRVEPKSVKYLDFSKGVGPAAVQELAI
ncbi:MAG: pyridoxamine 5'-phosphate oxidase family protein [Clostridia bacterium]|nr:pyridoxamine 5'-phosphate oxidase family protein [Clostridia bacterium]